MGAAEGLVFEAQLGGFYTYTNDEGTWSVFRLLDFAPDAIQCALYREHFEAKPTLDEVLKLQPFIGHAPLSTSSLFADKDLEFLGATPVKGEDLEGYAHYMGEIGLSEERITEVVARIGQLARQGNVRLKLTPGQHEVQVEEL